MGSELHGHTQTALCVATTTVGQIVTGGEQGELCLWGVAGSGVSESGTPASGIPRSNTPESGARGSNVTESGVPGSNTPESNTGEAVPAEWSLLHKVTVEGEDDITSIVCSRRRADLMYIAAGVRVMAMDIKQLDSPLLTFRFNDEEVNQVALDDKEEYLAAADDSGKVKVISLFDRRVHKTLRKHSNICATIAFNPRRPWDLYSGGYDSQLVQWDYSRGRSVCVLNMEELGVHSDESTSYLVNPPFVHSVATDDGGNYLACGTEGAMVQLFHINKRNPGYYRTLHGHTQGVSQVHFPRTKPGHLVSAGNDGKILVWNLSVLSSVAVVTNGFSSDDAQAAQTPAPVTTATFTINHGAKVNWITSLHRNDETFLIVTDSEDRVMVYPYPN